MKANSLAPARALLALILALALLATACASRPSDCCPCPAEGQLSKELLLQLASVRALHHKADMLLKVGDKPGALVAVRQILLLDLNNRWPEAEEARLDAAARLAKLLLDMGQADEALKETEKGIEGVTRDSFYLSNLHSVRGEVLEQQVKVLDSGGMKEEARSMARQAIAAFELSIAINKRLQDKLGKGAAVTEESK